MVLYLYIIDFINVVDYHCSSQFFTYLFCKHTCSLHLQNSGLRTRVSEVAPQII